MKRFKLICSAIAALSMLALAGCDLEIPKENRADKLDTSVTVDNVPFTKEGEILPSTTVLIDTTRISQETGLSVSFWLLLGEEGEEHDDNTYEWQTPVKIADEDAVNIVYIDVGPLGVFLKDGGENLYEHFAKRGSDFTEDNWKIFCWERQKMYMTVSFNADGSIVYYKNGKRALTYESSTVVKDLITVKDGCEAAINYALNGDFTLHATEEKDYIMEDVTIDVGLDDDGVSKQFANVSKE